MSIRVFNDLASACDYCEVIPERFPTHAHLIKVQTVANTLTKNASIEKFQTGEEGRAAK